MININLDKCGGLTEELKLARAARMFGKQVMVGCMGGSTLAMAQSTPPASGGTPAGNNMAAQGKCWDAASNTVKDKSKTIVSDVSASQTLAADYSITFTGNFKAVKGHTYTVTVNASEPNGHDETRSSAVAAL